MGAGADPAVDGDLGVSGRDAHRRESYKELVTRVCQSEVGALFGLEIARLARNNAELLRLLEFCALTDTLVLDTDGIYDLQDFNDRLLLGLKAQMSEAELHVMAGRLQGAKRAAAERGELRFGLPVGYVYDEDGHGSSTPMRRYRRRSPTCLARSWRPARHMGSSALSRVGGSPSGRGVGRGRASCAGAC